MIKQTSKSNNEITNEIEKILNSNNLIEFELWIEREETNKQFMGKGWFSFGQMEKGVESTVSYIDFLSANREV